MTTTSFPIKDVNISHTMWRDLFGATAGIFDPLNEGLGLTLSAVSDVATVATGKYRFRGFDLKVTVAHGLTLAAAVGSPKTHIIGILYTAADEDAADGPLSLTSYLSGSEPDIDTFAPLYKVVRQPSQTLNLAAVTDLRQWVLPPIFRQGGALPDPADHGYGQILFQNFPESSSLRDVLVRGGGVGTEEWLPLLAPHGAGTDDFTDISLTSGLSAFSAGTTPYYTRAGGKFILGGSVKLTSGASFAVGQTYTVASFSGANAPRRARNLPVTTAYSGSGPAARVSVSTAGIVTFTTAAATSWFSLDGVDWFPKGS